MIFKTRNFARWARKSGLSDSLLKMAVFEIQRGLLEADLGGRIVKSVLLCPGEASVAVREHCWRRTGMTDGFLYLVLKRTNV
jgi:hypothetical protein